MSRIIDLSMPIEDHFRWPVERRVRGDHDQGDVFQATWLGWTVHGFTHMDSPRHCVPGGPTTDDVALETHGRRGGRDRSRAGRAERGDLARAPRRRGRATSGRATSW